MKDYQSQSLSAFERGQKVSKDNTLPLKHEYPRRTCCRSVPLKGQHPTFETLIIIGH